MFDTKCFELAEHFLPDNAREQVKNELAQHIQTSIEDWLGPLEQHEIVKAP